jgi:hypothetical protein
MGQFFRALSPEVPECRIQAAIQSLGPEAQTLFLGQEAQDQRHAIAVHAALREQGYSDPDLLTAALLHDAGKAAAPCPPWVRALAVLMGQFAPRILSQLTPSSPLTTDRTAPWRRALSAHVHHAEVGARWAEEAGCSARSVALIRRHREHIDASALDEDELLIALMKADAVH